MTTTFIYANHEAIMFEVTTNTGEVLKTCVLSAESTGLATIAYVATYGLDNNEYTRNGRREFDGRPIGLIQEGYILFMTSYSDPLILDNLGIPKRFWRYFALRSSDRTINNLLNGKTICWDMARPIHNGAIMIV